MRNVDPRARQRARDAARAEGITVGEWLNRKLLDAEAGGGRRRDGDSPEAVAAALDKLSRRIEAAEHRSTLAITGIDQSVLGLVSRLQSAEGSQSDFQSSARAALDDLREARAALTARIERLELDDRGDQNIEALKRLDANLAKLSEEVAQRHADTDGQFNALSQDVEALAKDVNATKTAAQKAAALEGRLDNTQSRLDRTHAGLKEAHARLDTVADRANAADAAVQRVQEHVSDLDSAITHVQHDVDDRLAKTQADINEQSSALRADVDGKLSGLEARADQNAAGLGDVAKTVDNLAGRLTKAANRVTGVEKQLGGVADRLEEAASQGDHAAELLARELADVRDQASQTSADLSDQAAHTNERLDALNAKHDAAKAELSTWMARHSDRLQSAEQAANTAIQALESSFASLEDRVRAGESATKHAASERAHLTDRLDTLSQEFTTLVEETRTDLAARLEDVASGDRIEEIEQRLGQLTDDVAAAERKRAMGLDRIISEVERLAASVDDRLAASEARVGDMVDTKLAAFDRDMSDLTTAVGAMDDAVDRGRADLEAKATEQAGRLEALAKNAIEDAARQNADLEQAVDSRLADAEARQDRALEEISDKVDAVASNLEQRLVDVDRHAQDAVDNVARRLSEAPATSVEADTEALEQRIRDSEMRTQDMLDAAMARVHKRIDAGDVATPEAAPSAMTHALASLTERLEALELSQPAPQEPAHHTPETEIAETPLKEVTDQSVEALEHAQDAMFEDDDYDDDLVFEDVSAETPEAAPRDPDRDALDDVVTRPGVADDDDALWSPFDDLPESDEPQTEHADESDALFEDEDDVLIAEAAVTEELKAGDADFDPFEDYPDPLNRYGDAATDDAPDAPDAFEADDVLEATDAEQAVPDDEALDVVSAYDDLAEQDHISEHERVDIDEDETTPHPGFGPAAPALEEPEADPGVKAKRNGRKLMVAASGAAFLAVGAAAYMVASENAEGRSANNDSEDRGVDPVSSAPAPQEMSGAAPRSSAASATESASPEALRADDAETAGDPVAQYTLGVQRLGEGQSDRAFRLLQRSADAGYAPAQFRLGQMYEAGRGVPQSLSDARRWTERAAQAGHREAMHNLGVYYANGIGVPESYEQSARWFKDAARLDNTDSQYNLGVLYEQGLGLSIDLVEAYAWYAIAASSGDAVAEQRARDLAARLTNSERARGDDKASQFTPAALDPVANGVVSDNIAPEALSRTEMIAEAQTLLEALGYAPGTADGSIGPRTETAIIAFQRAQSLAETGRVDSTLLEQLRAVAP